MELLSLMDPLSVPGWYIGLIRSDSDMLIGRLCMKIPVGVAIILSINIDIYRVIKKSLCT